MTDQDNYPLGEVTPREAAEGFQLTEIVVRNSATGQPARVQAVICPVGPSHRLVRVLGVEVETEYRLECFATIRGLKDMPTWLPLDRQHVATDPRRARQEAVLKMKAPLPPLYVLHVPPT